LATQRTLRTLDFADETDELVPRLLRISSLGYVVAYCESAHFHELQVHSLQNGARVARYMPSSILLSLAMSANGEYLVTGGENGTVSLFAVIGSEGFLQLIADWKCESKVCSLALVASVNCEAICAGLESGALNVIELRGVI